MGQRLEVYVELLDEDVRVWRPAVAEWIDGGWRLVEPEDGVPDGEVWSVLPGSLVTLGEAVLGRRGESGRVVSPVAETSDGEQPVGGVEATTYGWFDSVSGDIEVESTRERLGSVTHWLERGDVLVCVCVWDHVEDVEVTVGSVESGRVSVDHVPRHGVAAFIHEAFHGQGRPSR